MLLRTRRMCYCGMRCAQTNILRPAAVYQQRVRYYIHAPPHAKTHGGTRVYTRARRRVMRCSALPHYDDARATIVVQRALLVARATVV